MSIEALYNFKHSYSLGILDVNFTSSYKQFVIERNYPRGTIKAIKGTPI